MTQLNPYLTFNGNCEEAFNYYQSMFGNEFTQIMRFKDVPPGNGPEIEEKYLNRIMHIGLPINEHTILMGSDANPAMGNEVPSGKNIILSIQAESREQADKFFQALAEGGQVEMPISDMFWGDYFGMVEDKFGISWMVSYNNNQ